MDRFKSHLESPLQGSVFNTLVTLIFGGHRSGESWQIEKKPFQPSVLSVIKKAVNYSRILYYRLVLISYDILVISMI